MAQFTLPLVGGDPVSLTTLVEQGLRLLVFAHADCPTSHLALRHLAQLEAGPVKPVLIAEEPPEEAARMARRSGVGFPVLAQEAPFPVSDQFGIEAVPTAVLVDASSRAVESLVGWDRAGYERLLGGPLPDLGPAVKPGCGSRLHEPAVRAGLDEVEDMFERGWTDGLPVVPPTPERVERMLGGRDAGRSLGAVPPSGGEATLERVAACAVLAGCRPEYFPVVEAAVQAALDPVLNPHGLAVTTQAGGVVMVVNGPARERLGLNAGMGALGPGARANMTIGRALRLVLTLTGDARRAARPIHAQHSGQARPLHRRGRGAEPVAAAARRTRHRAGQLGGDRDRRRRAAFDLGSPIANARRAGVGARPGGDGHVEPVLVADG